MYAGRVGATALVCAVVLGLAGCVSTAGGQSRRAGTPAIVGLPHRTLSPTQVPLVAPASTAPTTTLPERSDKPTTMTPRVTIRPRPKFRNIVVSGVVRGVGEPADRHVVVGFRRTTCPACAPMTVKTDGRGGYSASLPMDRYAIACVAAGPYVCTVAGYEDLAATVAFRADTILDLVVQPRDPIAAAPPTADGHRLYGRVVADDGRPVSDATIALLSQHAQNDAFVHTARDGSYRIAAVRGRYVVVCATPDPAYRCGPVGGDVRVSPVEIGDRPQRIEFVRCALPDYPGCLSR